MKYYSIVFKHITTKLFALVVHNFVTTDNRSVVTRQNNIVGDHSYYEDIEVIKKLISLLTGDLLKK